MSLIFITLVTYTKFRFPSHDPKPNSVIDTRTDSQKVSDIIRIWSQVLRPDEKLLWSEIAEIDLTQTLSLPSGMRLPKSFIEKDIKQFRDLNKQEKTLLLQNLVEPPNGPIEVSDTMIVKPPICESGSSTLSEGLHSSLDQACEISKITDICTKLVNALRKKFLQDYM